MKKVQRHLSVLLSLPILVCGLLAAQPGWWTDEAGGTAIIDSSKAPDSLAVAILAQLKHVATQARKHVEDKLPHLTEADWNAAYGGAANNPFRPGGPLDPTAQAGVDNRYVLTQGQLKYIADGFYNLLIAQGVDTQAQLNANMLPGDTWSYDRPWTPQTDDDATHAPVTLGQLKFTFSFSLEGFVPFVDTDGDGLPDDWEITHFGNLSQSGTDDTDADGLTNIEEFRLMRNPSNADEDNDGLPDGFEYIIIDADPQDSIRTLEDVIFSDDFDGDGLANNREHQLGTDPTNPDQDADGLSDGFEYTIIDRSSSDGYTSLADVLPEDDFDADGLTNLEEYTQGTNAIFWDTDRDGLSDGDEVHIHGTDPLKRDMDGDGLTDGAEISTHGTDPQNADTDGDTMPDGYEVGHGLNANANDATGDLDGDGVSNINEYKQGTKPNNPDSDGDGLGDGGDPQPNDPSNGRVSIPSYALIPITNSEDDYNLNRPPGSNVAQVTDTGFVFLEVFGSSEPDDDRLGYYRWNLQTMSGKALKKAKNSIVNFGNVEVEHVGYETVVGISDSGTVWGNVSVSSKSIVFGEPQQGYFDSFGGTVGVKWAYPSSSASVIDQPSINGFLGRLNGNNDPEYTDPADIISAVLFIEEKTRILAANEAGQIVRSESIDYSYRGYSDCSQEGDEVGNRNIIQQKISLDNIYSRDALSAYGLFDKNDTWCHYITLSETETGNRYSRFLNNAGQYITRDKDTGALKIQGAANTVTLADDQDPRFLNDNGALIFTKVDAENPSNNKPQLRLPNGTIIDLPTRASQMTSDPNGHYKLLGGDASTGPSMLVRIPNPPDASGNVTMSNDFRIIPINPPAPYPDGTTPPSVFSTSQLSAHGAQSARILDMSPNGNLLVQLGNSTTPLQNPYFIALPVEIKHVDRDDPTKKYANESDRLDANLLTTTFYAGSPEVQDHVSFKVPDAFNLNVINWRFEPADGYTNLSTITGPVTGNEWVLDGGAYSFDWEPGRYKLMFDIGSAPVTVGEIEVGLRTEEYIVVGAILEETSVPTAGVDASTIDHFECPEIAFRLLFQDFNDPNDAEHVPEEDEDRLYVNYRIVNTTDNTTPVGSIDPDDSPENAYGLDPDTHYRFFGRCQFKYKVASDGSISDVMPVGSLVDLAGETPAPCGLGYIGAPDPNGVTHANSGSYSVTTSGDELTYLVKVRAGSGGQSGYQELNRRELPWVFFRFRFDGEDGLIKTDFSAYSEDPDGPIDDSDSDYSSMPTIWLFKRYYDGSQFKVDNEQQTQQDFIKFLEIGTVTGSPSYP